MVRVILHNAQDGRILRDEQFEPVDERDIPKSVTRAVRAAMRVPENLRINSLEFRLTIIRFPR